MNAILMAINQKWCDLILSGQKNVEVRKRIPQRFSAPFRVYLYRTRGEDRNGQPGMVVGEFICDKVYGLEREKLVLNDGERLDRWVWTDEYDRYDLVRKRDLCTCLTGDELKRYLGNGKRLYGLHVSAPKRYETPLTLEEVMRCRHLDRDGVCGAFMRVTQSETGAITLKRMSPPCPYQYVDYFNPTYRPSECQCRKVVNVTPPQSWQYVEDEDVQAARIWRECERQQNSNQKPVNSPSKITFSEKETCTPTSTKQTDLIREEGM